MKENRVLDRYSEELNFCALENVICILASLRRRDPKITNFETVIAKSNQKVIGIINIVFNCSRFGRFKQILCTTVVLWKVSTVMNFSSN